MKQILGVRPVKEFTLHPHRCEGTLLKVWRVDQTPFLHVLHIKIPLTDVISNQIDIPLTDTISSTD